MDTALQNRIEKLEAVIQAQGQRIQSLENALEDREDLATIAAYSLDRDATLPGHVVDSILDDGLHPIKAVREWRALTQTELAEAVESTPAYISQIETGQRKASKKLLGKIANALTVDIGLIVD